MPASETFIVYIITFIEVTYLDEWCSINGNWCHWNNLREVIITVINACRAISYSYTYLCSGHRERRVLYSLLFLEFRSTTDGKRSSDVARPQTNSSSHEPVQRRRLLPREVWYALVSLQCLTLSSPQRGMVCCRITAVPNSFFSPERYGMLSYHCSA